uniref:Peptidase M48 domain-containing protein n=1 Tax=Oryza glumipatula TaxID=40148 RepID=A0A0D9YXX3_9ORYZ
MSTVSCLACRFLWGSTPSPHPALGRSTTPPHAARWYKRPLPRAAAAASVVASAAVWLFGHQTNASPRPNPSLTYCSEAFLARSALPESHPDTVRVRRVAANIVSTTLEDAVFGQRRLSERIGHRFVPGINWRVHVINDDKSLACCLESGEILVFTGFLNAYCQKDDDLATTLGHEQQHDSDFDGTDDDEDEEEGSEASSSGEEEKGRRWERRIGYYEHAASRRCDLPQAAAGYDPRANPNFWEALMKFGNGEGTTHPPLQRRAAEVRQEKVMGEALEVFREAVQRHVHA